MLRKFLQKRLQKFKLNAPYSQMLASAMARLSRAPQYNMQVQWIVKACRQLIKILQAMNVNDNFEQIKQMMKVVQDLTMQIHNDDIYQLLLIKIRCFLINLKIRNQNDNKRIKRSHKLSIFLQSLEHSRFYLLLQQDFYSNLQLVYLQAIKVNFIEQNPPEALNFIKLCMQTVKKQLTFLSEFGSDNSGQKMNKILQNKNKTLELLFYFQHGARYACSNTPSNQIITELLSKYERLFIKTTMQFNSNQLVAKTSKTIHFIQHQVNPTNPQIQAKDITINQQKSQPFSENSSNPQIFIPTILQFPSSQTSQFRINSNSNNRLNVNSQQILSSCQNIESGYNIPMFASSKNQLLSIPNQMRLQQSMKFIDQLKGKKPNQKWIEALAPRISIQLPSEGIDFNNIKENNFRQPSRFIKSKSQQLFDSQEPKEAQSSLPMEKAEKPEQSLKISNKIKKKKKQFRTRTFSLVVRAKKQEKQKLKLLVPQKQNKKKIKLRTSQAQMLKNGIFVFGCGF